MLQQTRVASVIPYYERFLQRFPDAKSLALADEAEVLTHWSGLGYYSRARNLLQAAKKIYKLGNFPRTYADIRQLPGIGDYTAAAVSSIAFHQPHAVVDGNVKRIAARLTNDGRVDAQVFADQALDRKAPGDFNQAMMELGAVICLPRNPQCGQCPVKDLCGARKAGTQHELPLPRERAPQVKVKRTLLLMAKRQGKKETVLLTPSIRVKGFWDLPEGPSSSAKPLATFQHSIMNRRYTFEVVKPATCVMPKGSRNWGLQDLRGIPLSTVTKKALKLLAMLALNVSLFAYSLGPPARSTAGPGDDPPGCATGACHSGPINRAGGGVSVTFSSGTVYTPGQPLTVTVTVFDPTNVLFGFQMSARLESNLTKGQSGTFTPGVGTRVVCDNDILRNGPTCSANFPVEFIEHDTPARAPWTFTWTPPAKGSGTVHFYVAGNAVNGDGAAGPADHVYLREFTLTENTCMQTKPVITSAVSASDFGGFPSFAAGSWLEIKGTNFIADPSKSRTWQAADFKDPFVAPTNLDGVTASVNGKAAFVYYISPGQVNVQAPADASTGNAQITVSNCAGASSPITLPKAATAPGFLAPAKFRVNGNPYLVAQFFDDAFVGTPGLIAGYQFRPAKPGDVLRVYGVGFGEVTPAYQPGAVVNKLNDLVVRPVIRMGGIDAAISYAGLAPGYVGLYQFNFTVPDVASGDVPVTGSLNGVALPQQLYLTVSR